MVFRFNNKVKIIGAYKLLRCETWELFCNTYKILHRKQEKTWITVQEFITLPPKIRYHEGKSINTIG